MNLKLITTCEVAGDEIKDFLSKMNRCGFYVYVEDYFENEELTDEFILSVMIFKFVTNRGENE